MTIEHPTHHLSDLLKIQQEPGLKELFDLARIERCSRLYQYLDDLLLPGTGSGVRVMVLADGTKGLATPRAWSHSLPGLDAKFGLMGARIDENGAMRMADDAITAYLKTPSEDRFMGSEEWPMSANKRDPLFTVTQAGDLYGPLSDLAVVVDVLENELWSRD